jgi:ubiquitin-activating enzyme E1
MTELNSLKPTIIETIGGYSFKLHVDGTGFGAFTGTGLVENVKVPKTVKYHSLRESLKNPAMLETPDQRCWGRSDQLHLAYLGIFEF